MSPRHVSRPVAELTRLTEAQYQANIKSLAQSLGYMVYHNLYAPGSDRGFPDLVMVRPAVYQGLLKRRQGRIIFAELKGPRPHESESQREWLATLNLAGAEVYLWYSEKDSLQEIADILAS